MTIAILLPFISFAIGMVGAAVGAYVGMKVGLVRLETWCEMTGKNIARMEKTLGTLEEDSLVHDFEIGDLMARQGLARARRQRLRE